MCPVLKENKDGKNLEEPRITINNLNIHYYSGGRTVAEDAPTAKFRWKAITRRITRREFVALSDTVWCREISEE